MTYDLYVDVLFLVNFVMDFLLLTVLSKVMKLKGTVIRRVLSGMLGAGWAVFVVVWPVMPRVLEGMITYVLISGLMVKTAYRLKGMRDIGRAVLGLYLTAVTVGGMMYALYQHTKAGYYIEQVIRGNVAEAMPAYILILLMTGGFFGTKYLWLQMLDIKRKMNNIFLVTLYYRGKTEVVSALMDTGNHLYEPVTHKPVHVITYEACRQLCESVPAVVYIPFQSVGTKKGMMPGIYLDSMEVEQNGQLTTVQKPLVAICRQSLSPSGEYQMLLHEEI